MKLFNSFLLIFVFLNVDGQNVIYKSGQSDSLVNIIRHIMATGQDLPAAVDYDKAVRKSMYGRYIADTVKKDLFSATVYSYANNIKILTDYFFLEKKLIRVDVYNVPIKKQTFKNIKHKRTYMYWNDLLIYAEDVAKELSDTSMDFRLSKEVLKRFDEKYVNGELNFDEY